MDQQRSSLCVSIHNVEFAKDYNYFITVQVNADGEKRRTDISACVSNPIFTANVFILPLSNFKLDINDRLHLCAFVVTDREEHPSQDLESKGQARLLGECHLDLGPLTAPLTDISGTGVKQHVKFTRQQFTSNEKEPKEVTVGKCILNLKLVGEQLFPIDQQVDLKPLEENDIFHPLPVSDPFMDFIWRLRIDIRSAVDLPLNRSTPTGLPSCYVEVGWVLYKDSVPDENSLYMTKIIESNRHPIWNQQFLIPNPQNIVTNDGFLYLCVKDKFTTELIDAIYFPLKSMKGFHPYNFELVSSKQEYEARGKIYVSFCLEMPSQDTLVDALAEIVIHKVHFDPLPLTNKMFLIMTLHSHKPNMVPFISVDLKNPKTMAKVLEESAITKQRTFISQIMKIPPNMVETLYEAVAVFTLPKTSLQESVSFYVAGRDEKTGTFHAMPNAVCGHTDLIDESLKKLYYAKEKSNALIPVIWEKDSSLYPIFSTTKCMLEIGSYGQQDTKNYLMKKRSTMMVQRSGTMNLDYDRVPNENNNYSAALSAVKLDGIQSDREKWQILSKELAQKQEIIHRMIKEIDDKTDAIKITGSEIVELRRQIKLLQSENAILRKRLAHEEQIEIGAIVTKEISKMSVEELKAKIIKIAQAYRDERVRNEEFEKALKAAQRDVAQARSLQVELENLQRVHQQNSKKLLSMQSEISKTQLYRETIKKQEKVISKLETLMESSLKDTQKARDAMFELEQIKTENVNLQKQLKNMVYGNGENSEVEKYRTECARLERIIAELREDLKAKRPTTSYGNDSEKEKLELEVKLQRANARVEALQEELTDSARNYAKEIANLKMIIAEKQALLDSLQMDF